MLTSSLCGYSDMYILVKGIITITGAGARAILQWENKKNKQVTFKNCTPFTNSINQINNAQVDDADV